MFHLRQTILITRLPVIPMALLRGCSLSDFSFTFTAELGARAAVVDDECEQVA
jgi:hypothetical protein